MFFNSYVFECCPSALTESGVPQSFSHLSIALPTKLCSESAQKSAVQVCHVVTVMETTQLVLSQF